MVRIKLCKLKIIRRLNVAFDKSIGTFVLISILHSNSGKADDDKFSLTFEEGSM